MGTRSGAGRDATLACLWQGLDLHPLLNLSSSGRRGCSALRLRTRASPASQLHPISMAILWAGAGVGVAGV